jgi:predicted AAA+ superfamily ATPase
MPSPRYLHRALEPVLMRAAREFPVVLLTGPRQAGKTTLLKHAFGRRCSYVSLDAPDMRAAATADPRGFLAEYPPPAILDEMQHAPDLFSYVKEKVDADRGTAGQYFITGSQNLLLTARVSETLAGRAAVLRLWPLSRRELERQPTAALPWEAPPRGRRRGGVAHAALWRAMLRGGFPEIALAPRRDPQLWQSSYLGTYLERDVRGLRQIGDLGSFQSFVRVLAARSGQLLNLSDVARDLGVAVNTAKAWLSVLEASYQVLIVRPYFANLGKRLVKMPKVYLTDTGLLAHLTGLRDPAHAASGPLSGALFETAVLSELVKALQSRGEEPRVHFWRTAAGAEVDFVVETPRGLVPIEVKATATPQPRMGNAILTLQHDLGGRVAAGYVVHTGDTRISLGPGVTALPFGEL